MPRLFLPVFLLLGLPLAAAREGNPVPGATDYYELENIALPEGEFSVDAVAFLPDGRLACCLSLSKIYTYHPGRREWRLFAEGLHTPLGLFPLSDTEIIVAQRPEITLVTDRDGDGKADRFRTLSDAFGLSGNYAEFNFGPVRDADGDFYFGLGTGSAFGKVLTNEVRGLYSRTGHHGRMNSCVPYRGWIMKLASDGRTIPWANGFREPNGLGFDLDGNLFVPDNQGDFVGSSALFQIRKGGFYGHPHSLVWRPGFNRHPFDVPVAELNRLRSRPAVVFPHGEMANSPAQPLCDTTRGRFGPFAGQMFIGAMNFPRLLRVMLEEIDGELQGACTPFFDKAGLNLGNNRLAFHPADGSLWIGQTKHQAWVGASGLQRLKWRGVTPMEVHSMKLNRSGFDLVFTRPVDPDTATDPAAYALERYHYNYHEKYGSEKHDRTTERVQAVSLSPDRRTVSLALDSLSPWHLYDLRISGVASRDGHPLLNPWLVYTLNRLPANTPPPPDPLPTPPPKRTVPTVPAGGVKSIGGPQEFTATNTPSRVKVHRTEGGFRFTEDGRDILVYNKEPMAHSDQSHRRAHYIHPLYDLDGVRMTDDMPADHLHHRGIFWSWMQLWIGDRRIGCPWEQKDTVWDVRDVRVAGGRTSTALEILVHWKSPLQTGQDGTQIPIVEERTTIRVHQSSENARLIDFEIRLRALLEEVRLGGSDNTKGYGGFSARIPLPPDLETVGPDGPVAVDTTRPSPPQPWVDFSADFGGRGKTSGLAILCHPSLPGFPPGWTIRRAKSCQNPVFPGRAPVALPTDEPLVLRYRIVLHRGPAASAGLPARFEDYRTPAQEE